jgi:ABC-type nickel/cobalt efflux system permease component RcnA
MRSIFSQRFIVGLLLFLVFGMLIKPEHTAQAHPADQYKQLHEVIFTPTTIKVNWMLYPGALLAPSIWSEADTDGNDTIDFNESFSWAAPRIAYLLLTLDENTQMRWEVETVEFPESLTEFQLSNQAITIQLYAEYPPFFSGKHFVELQNRYEEGASTSWYYVYTEGDVAFCKPQQQANLLEIEFVLAPETTGIPSTDLLKQWDSGLPSISASGGTSVALVPPSDNTSRFGKLNDLLQRTDYGMIVLIAIVLGGFHALTPGHGKALVGAYLVGSRGTFRHAIVLGLVVTLTHTGSVAVVGILTLIASQFFVPTQIFPILEIASGLLVIGLGIFLLRQRWRGFMSVAKKHEASQKSDAESLKPETQVESQPKDSTPSASTTRRIEINQPIKVNVYNDVLDNDARTIRWRSLFGLGFSGGLVPCPEAIVTLLIAVALKQIVMGLSLILAFSGGMALVLVAIGLAIVASSSTLSKNDLFSRAAPAISVISGVVVLLLGVGLTVNAIQGSNWLSNAEARADQAIESQTENEKEFDISRASILFTAPDDTAVQQIFSIQLDETLTRLTRTQLTFEPNGIWTYSLSPDRQTIIYSIRQPYEESGLWVVDIDGNNRRLALDCPEADCGNPIWTPDGRRIIYERINISESYEPDYGIITLWSLSAVDGTTQPLFEDLSFQGYAARWSPDGQWIGYISPQNVGIQLYNLTDGRNFSIPTQVSSTIVWNPDSSSFLYLDLELDADGKPLKRLKHFDIETEQISILSQDALIEERWAAWSPNGEWIAVVRGILSDTGVLQGDQIWVMRPDGRDDRAIIESPGFAYGSLTWSSDSRYLTFTQYALSIPGSNSEIAVLDTQTGAIRGLVAPAYAPSWLP